MSLRRPPFPVFPVLRTRHLVLDQVKESDMEQFEELGRFSSQIKKLKTARAVWEMAEQEYQAGRAVNWGLFLKGELIGTCGFYRGFDDLTSEIGYVMRSAFRRKGYMREAVEAIIAFGQHDLKLKLITAYTTDQNMASIALLQEQGFTRTEEVSDVYRRYELWTPRK